MSKSKLANRSDRQARGPGRHHRRVPYNGLSHQSDGKFLQLSPEEIRARDAAQRKLALREAERRGLGTVKRAVALELRAMGVPVEAPVPATHSGMHAKVHLVPKSIADAVRIWEEAQIFAGPAAHTPYAQLKLKTVLELAVVEWKDQGEGK